MSDPVLVLDFTLTVDDLRVPMSRCSRCSWYDWQRRLMALVLLGMSVSAWPDEGYVFRGLAFLFAAYLMVPSGLSFWWLFRLMSRNQPPMHVRLELDDTGMRMHSAEHKTHNRWWWSRLTGVVVGDGSYELMFDGDSHAGMYIPAHAFADDEQLETFRNLIEQHLPGPTSGNRGASPSDSPAFRFGAG